MSKKQKIQTLVACCVIFVIIFLDQWLKIWVKTKYDLRSADFCFWGLVYPLFH